LGEGPAPLDLQDRELPPLQSLFSFVARIVSGMGFSRAVEAFKLIGALAYARQISQFQAVADVSKFFITIN
jgi:hypothetical protein